MTIYRDECETLVDIIDSYRNTKNFDTKITYLTGFSIFSMSKEITDIGERDLRKFLATKGQTITEETGDGSIFSFNPSPNFELIKEILDEVYDLLQFELTAAPA